MGGKGKKKTSNVGKRTVTNDLENKSTGELLSPTSHNGHNKMPPVTVIRDEVTLTNGCHIMPSMEWTFHRMSPQRPKEDDPDYMNILNDFIHQYSPELQASRSSSPTSLNHCTVERPMSIGISSIVHSLHNGVHADSQPGHKSVLFDCCESRTQPTEETSNHFLFSRGMTPDLLPPDEDEDDIEESFSNSFSGLTAFLNTATNSFPMDSSTGNSYSAARDFSSRLRHRSDDPCSRGLTHLKHMFSEENSFGSAGTEKDTHFSHWLSSWWSTSEANGANGNSNNATIYPPRYSPRLANSSEQFSFDGNPSRVGWDALAPFGASNPGSCHCRPHHQEQHPHGADSAYGTASRSSLVATPQSMLRHQKEAIGPLDDYQHLANAMYPYNLTSVVSGGNPVTISQPSPTLLTWPHASTSSSSSKLSHPSVSPYRDGDSGGPPTFLHSISIDSATSIGLDPWGAALGAGGVVPRPTRGNNPMNQIEPHTMPGPLTGGRDRRCVSSCAPLAPLQIASSSQQPQGAHLHKNGGGNYLRGGGGVGHSLHPQFHQQTAQQHSTTAASARERTRSDPKYHSSGFTALTTSRSMGYAGKGKHLNKSEEQGNKPTVGARHRACSFFLRGHCKKEDCQFAHNLDLVVCRFWAESECFKGDACPFRHRPLSDDDDDNEDEKEAEPVKSMKAKLEAPLASLHSTSTTPLNNSAIISCNT